MLADEAITVPPSVRRLRWVALAAAAGLTASGEYQLAVLVGIHPSLAWLLPVALDIYAWCAFAAGRRADVRAALVLMIGCQAVAHLLAVGAIRPHWSIVIVVSAIAPVVCWRVHHLGERPGSRQNVPEHRSADAGMPEQAAARVPDAPPAFGRLPRQGSGGVPDVPPVVGRRPAAETRRLALQMLVRDPNLTQKEIAARLGISARRLRTVLNPA